MTHAHPRPGHRALRRGRISLPNCAYLITTVCRERAPVFASRAAATAVADILRTPAIWSGALPACWVLMPDHLHAVLVLPENKTLSDVVRRLKCVTASITNRRLGRRGPLWSAAYHDHAVRAEEDLHHIVEYVLANPIRAGICTDLRDYPYLYSRHDCPD